MTKCTLPISSNCNDEIAYVLDEPLYDYAEIEHQVIRDGLDELFTFTGIELEGEFNWIKMKSLHLQINLLKEHP